MTRLLVLSVLFVLTAAGSASAPAQVLPAQAGPIVYGHHHVNASSIDEHKRFWIDALGGSIVRIGENQTEAVRFAGALLFMRAQKPTGGSKGTTVDHLGFSVPNLRQVVDRVKAAGFRMVTASEAPPNVPVRDDIGIVDAGGVTGIAYALGPDDVKVELVEMRAQAEPIVSHHVHFFGPEAEMHAWYAKVFGAKGTPSTSPAFIRAELPGIGLNFSAGKDVAGTQGRAIDHIGFEVRNLEAFTKRLEADGITLAVPYRQVPALGIAIAFITDPWGTSIELTEGLDKVR